MLNNIQKNSETLCDDSIQLPRNRKVFTSRVDPPPHLLLFLLSLLLLVSPGVALFWDWLYSHIRFPSQRFSSQSSNITVICILFTLQLPKEFCQSLLIYFPHHLIHMFKQSNCQALYHLGKKMLQGNNPKIDMHFNRTSQIILLK